MSHVTYYLKSGVEVSKSNRLDYLSIRMESSLKGVWQTRELDKRQVLALVDALRKAAEEMDE